MDSGKPPGTEEGKVRVKLVLTTWAQGIRQLEEPVRMRISSAVMLSRHFNQEGTNSASPEIHFPPSPTSKKS
jgi:hypothetical protein